MKVCLTSGLNMKFLLFLAFAATLTATAESRLPIPMLKTQVVSCTKGVEGLTIELVSNPNIDAKKIIATFVEYKRGDKTLYSSSSFDQPIQTNQYLYTYVAKGNGTEVSRTLTFSWGRKGFCSKLDTGLFNMCCNIN